MSDGNRLIPDFDHYDKDNLSDVYMLCAFAIEQTFVDVGAVPGKDYSYMDLMKLAQPHVLKECESRPLNIEALRVKK